MSSNIAENDSIAINLDGNSLSIEDLARVAREHNLVGLAEGSLQKISESRNLLEQWLQEEKIVYGITTGFGPLVSTIIPVKYQEELQRNLIRSHSANVGPLFSREETRAAMLLRANVFAKGYSAVRLDTIQTLVSFLNSGIHPCVPQWGSVGASGDLTPSAHIALALMGEGEVEYKGERMPSIEALKRSGLSQVSLAAKEGLALINGTTMMTGVGALQVFDAWNAVKNAEIIAAVAFEALHASIEPLLAEAQKLKPHPGQLRTAQNLTQYLNGSKLIMSREDLEVLRDKLRLEMKNSGEVIDTGKPMQNVYSLRATPQIIGAVRGALDYVTSAISIEMNSSNDNPLFLPEMNMSYQGAHFHGQTVALPLDTLSIALTEIAVLSERRLNKMLDKDRSGGLSPFLARGKSGLRCGFEGAQYIPTSLVAECRTLCNPASIQSIPSNGENQDVVSMGLVAARKARDIKERIEYVLAVELLAACEAMEERDQKGMAPVTAAVYAHVRESVPSYDSDEFLHPHLEKAKEIIHSGSLLKVVQNVLGEAIK